MPPPVSKPFLVTPQSQGVGVWGGGLICDLLCPVVEFSQDSWSCSSLDKDAMFLHFLHSSQALIPSH